MQRCATLTGRDNRGAGLKPVIRDAAIAPTALDWQRLKRSQRLQRRVERAVVEPSTLSILDLFEARERGAGGDRSVGGKFGQACHPDGALQYVFDRRSVRSAARAGAEGISADRLPPAGRLREECPEWVQM
jgi:hypothetical protein